MKLKRALLASFIVHGILFTVLLSGIEWSWRSLKKPMPPIEAHLVIKNKTKNKELLPKKVKAPPENIQNEKESKKAEAKAVEEKKEDPLALKQAVPAKKTLENAAKKPGAPSKIVKENTNYLKKLSSLSQAFAKELETEEVVEPEGEVADDSTYFDQVYTLIKESFVVPPHLDGPKGQNLSAIVRIFLASDGSLQSLDLEVPSGDEHFDRAVVDGTKRVNNFGAVPIFLQNVLRERGIVVELCPVKCKER